MHLQIIFLNTLYSFSSFINGQRSGSLNEAFKSSFFFLWFSKRATCVLAIQVHTFLKKVELVAVELVGRLICR